MAASDDAEQRVLAVAGLRAHPPAAAAELFYCLACRGADKVLAEPPGPTVQRAWVAFPTVAAKHAALADSTGRLLYVSGSPVRFLPPPWADWDSLLSRAPLGASSLPLGAVPPEPDAPVDAGGPLEFLLRGATGEATGPFTAQQLFETRAVVLRYAAAGEVVLPPGYDFPVTRWGENAERPMADIVGPPVPWAMGAPTLPVAPLAPAAPLAPPPAPRQTPDSGVSGVTGPPGFGPPPAARPRWASPPGFGAPTQTSQWIQWIQPSRPSASVGSGGSGSEAGVTPSDPRARPGKGR